MPTATRLRTAHPKNYQSQRWNFAFITIEGPKADIDLLREILPKVRVTRHPRQPYEEGCKVEGYDLVENEAQPLKVTFAGPKGSGKSSIAYEFAQIFEQAGLEAEFVEETTPGDPIPPPF